MTSSTRRIVGIAAIVWAVGLAGTYIGCRARNASNSEPTTQTSDLAEDFSVLSSSKSAAVFGPADMQPSTSPATAPAARRLMPGSKSAPIEFDREPVIVEPEPPQPEPATKPRAVLPGSKSFRVDVPSAKPADSK